MKINPQDYFFVTVIDQSTECRSQCYCIVSKKEWKPGEVYFNEDDLLVNFLNECGLEHGGGGTFFPIEKTDNVKIVNKLNQLGFCENIDMLKAFIPLL